MQNEMPTKSNLIKIQQTLALAQQGYFLLDQKRKELVAANNIAQEKAKYLRAKLLAAQAEANQAFIRAVISMNPAQIELVANAIPLENKLQLSSKKIAGVEIITIDYKSERSLHYNLNNTTIVLDEACNQLYTLKKLIIEVAVAENTAKCLEEAIKKTQKRANALEHILIPRYKANLRFIQDVLEERERDGYVRLKTIKNKGNQDEQLPKTLNTSHEV